MDCLSSCSTWVVPAGFLALTGESFDAVCVSKYPNVEALLMEHLIGISEQIWLLTNKKSWSRLTAGLRSL